MMAIAIERQLEAAYVAGKRLVIASVRAKLDELLGWPLTELYGRTGIVANPVWDIIRRLRKHLDTLELQKEEEA